MQKIWLDAIDFCQKGGWRLESQFVRSVGQPYLIANDIPGEPVADACADFNVNEDGHYRIFVRTKNWKLPEAPGQFKVVIDDEQLTNTCGKMPTQKWYWEIAGDIVLSKGKHCIKLHDLTGWLSRCAAIVITNDMDFTPSPEIKMFLKQRANIKQLPSEIQDAGEWDFVVVGAGPAGVPAAIAAARKGLKTALICGRPTIGGNASIEGTIGLDGAGSRHRGMHETGIANEIKQVRNREKIVWQHAMEKLVAQEKNITVFCDELCVDAVCEGNKITSAITLNTKTLIYSSFKGKYFADCSGDAWLGYYAGAYYRIGREAKWEYDEKFAPESPDTLTMSGCICDDLGNERKKFRGFCGLECEENQNFVAPDWAISLPEGDALCRTPGAKRSADWWLENSNDHDDLWDDEFTRDEMLRLAVGYFHWLKNSYSKKEDFAKYKLIGLPLHNSKRENRRLIGDYVMTQNDFKENKDFPDAVTYCGWTIDIHHPKGIYSGREGEFYANERVPCTPIPFRCLYSKNIENLFMAGRCISVSHVALGSCRVESTIATEGQIVGTAAAYCLNKDTTPRKIYLEHIDDFKQVLLRDDITILNLQNSDSADIAKECEISVSSVADHTIISKMSGTYDEWLSVENSRLCGPSAKFLDYSIDYYLVELKNENSSTETLNAKLISFDKDNIQEYTVVEEIDIDLVPLYEGWFKLPFNNIVESGYWGIILTGPKGVLWRSRLPVQSSMIHYIDVDGKLIKINEGCQLRFSEEIDLKVDCGPQNVINGKSRSTMTESNAWISDSEKGLPQEITFTFPKRQEVSCVQIIADVDLEYPYYAYQKVPVSDKTIKDCTVSILNNGVWTVVAEVKDNIQRLIRIPFKKTESDAVKITVTKTFGAPYAKIYEVRIYEDTI